MNESVYLDRNIVKFPMFSLLEKWLFLVPSHRVRAKCQYLSIRGYEYKISKEKNKSFPSFFRKNVLKSRSTRARPLGIKNKRSTSPLSNEKSMRLQKLQTSSFLQRKSELNEKKICNYLVQNVFFPEEKFKSRAFGLDWLKTDWNDFREPRNSAVAETFSPPPFSSVRRSFSRANVCVFLHLCYPHSFDVKNHSERAFSRYRRLSQRFWVF